MNQHPEDEPGTELGSSSVRVAIVGFLGTLVLLLVMTVVWLVIRVEPSTSLRLQQQCESVASGQERSLCKRSISVLDDEGWRLVG